MTEPLDFVYLTGLARERQTAAANDPDRCTTGCRHRWHGLQCKTADCMCPSSYRENS